VQVCPTGVDIRRGVQMECIHCTACIDACDQIMTKMNRPTGLVRYGTLAMSRGEEPAGKWRPRFSVRAWIYAVLLAVVVGTLNYKLLTRIPFEVFILRAVDTPYQIIPGRRVTNHFHVDFNNLAAQAGKPFVSVSEELAQQGVKMVMPNAPALLSAGQGGRADLFIEFPQDLLEMGKAGLKVWVGAIHPETGENLLPPRMIEVPLVGPFKQ
jgi:polyferredoxin